MRNVQLHTDLFSNEEEEEEEEEELYCARTGAFPGAFCVPNSVALASPTLWGVQWAIH